MKDIVLVKYLFLIDSKTTWDNVFDFEKDLGKMAEERGFKAEVVEVLAGMPGERVVYFTKEDELLKQVNPPQEKPKAPSDILDKMSKAKRPQKKGK